MTPKEPSLPEVARVDDKTVQKVARGEKMPPRPPKRRWPGRGPPVAEVRHVRVDPEVWTTARGLTQDPRCIQIVSATEVIVWNHRPPWPGRGGGQSPA